MSGGEERSEERERSRDATRDGTDAHRFVYRRAHRTRDAHSLVGTLRHRSITPRALVARAARRESRPEGRRVSVPVLETRHGVSHDVESPPRVNPQPRVSSRVSGGPRASHLAPLFLNTNARLTRGVSPRAAARASHAAPQCTVFPAHAMSDPAGAGASATAPRRVERGRLGRGLPATAVRIERAGNHVHASVVRGDVHEREPHAEHPRGRVGGRVGAVHVGVRVIAVRLAKVVSDVSAPRAIRGRVQLERREGGLEDDLVRRVRGAPSEHRLGARP